MKSSCIRHPENNRFIKVHEWQLRFCNGNHCAALLLSSFITWHEWKLKHDQYYRKANNIAEVHGDGRPNSEKAYLFFTMEDLIEQTLGFYGKTAISDALQLLVSLKVISIHANPNPRYHFDKTKYFQFDPRICNSWIDENYPLNDGDCDDEIYQDIDLPKVANRESENSRRSAENSNPSAETSKAITNTTKNKTNKYQSINSSDDLLFENGKTNPPKNTEEDTSVQQIINRLIERGMDQKHFSYPDIKQTIKNLIGQGATEESFIHSYDIALKTASKGFGLNYLASIVKNSISRKATVRNQTEKVQPIDFDNSSHFKTEIPEHLKWLAEGNSLCKQE